MGANELQIIQAGFDVSSVADWTGAVILLSSSYALYVIRTINKSFEDHKELFRDYKRDVAVIIQELIECKNSDQSRLDKMEVEIEHICKEHNKNHG
jgi:hypothetical protein